MAKVGRNNEKVAGIGYVVGEDPSVELLTGAAQRTNKHGDNFKAIQWSAEMEEPK